MIDEKSKSILKRAFSVLNDEQVENFRWNLKNETPVYCLDEAGRVYDRETGKG